MAEETNSDLQQMNPADSTSLVEEEAPATPAVTASQASRPWLKTANISLAILVGILIVGYGLLQVPYIKHELIPYYVKKAQLKRAIDKSIQIPAPDCLNQIVEGVVIVRKDFFRRIEERDLLNGALAGINFALKKKKITDKELPLIPKSMTDRTAFYTDFADKVEIARVLIKGKMSDAEMAMYALNGVVAVTGDHYSIAMDAQEYKYLRQALGNDKYGGVGIYLESDRKNHNQLTVIEPIRNTPASRGGIQTGDCIMSINGKLTKNMDIEQASATIRGEIGTTVALDINRRGVPLTVKLTREDIQVPSVEAKMLDNQIAYMRVRFFGPETGEDFTELLSTLQEQNSKALILDLRNNGGGYVQAAVSIVSDFLPEGSVVTSIVSPHAQREEQYKVLTHSQTHLPLVVLVNRYSASASEITAGALKDYQRGVIVGETTFGKGSVQSIFDLHNGGALKLSIAHYLTPHSKDINLKGIEPDIVCEAEPSNHLGDSQDKQLQVALKEAIKLSK